MLDYSEDKRKETLTWWIRDWNFLWFSPGIPDTQGKETLTWWIRDWNWGKWSLWDHHFLGGKRNTDLMNKGLKLVGDCGREDRDDTKRNTDLMNKGLKLFYRCLREWIEKFKRNTDLMNKGLKLFRSVAPHSLQVFIKETLTWWIRDWNSSPSNLPGLVITPKRNTDLMNKGLKLIHFCFWSDSNLCKRNTDLMNKGLKHIAILKAVRTNRKRNTDLMNKGLKLN